MEQIWGSRVWSRIIVWVRIRIYVWARVAVVLGHGFDLGLAYVFWRSATGRYSVLQERFEKGLVRIFSVGVLI